MLTLKVASKANPAFTFPETLAVTFLSQHVPSKLCTVQYETADCLNHKSEEYVELVYDDLVLKNGAIVDHVQTILSEISIGKHDLVQQWLNRHADFAASDYKLLEKYVNEFDAYLTLRSYIVGYSMTLADVIIWAGFYGNKAAISLRKKSVNVSRWFDFVEAESPWISSTVASFEKFLRSRKAAASAAGASYNIGLKNTENGIITRFPPEPSGYLHIGHAKAALLNDYFAHEYPNPSSSRRALICRFDDTNPSKESAEFQDSILHDLSLLGITPDRISYSSDYFQEMYEACLKLIKDGKAYADNTPMLKMRDERMDGIKSACRDMPVEESVARFMDMKSGSEEGLKWCIRAKISIDDPNKSLRDPVIYRCNLQSHHRMGTSWKIYPTYDFCAPFLDSLEGVTHALRTNEYRDRNVQYEWMQNAMGIRSVDIWDFSRLNFVKTALSKRKLTTLVENGVVWGWDDPRMPTIRGIRRRGMTIPALREFILKQGPSKNILNLDWTVFWATNKKHIDPIAARYTAIPKEDAVTANVKGLQAVTVIKTPKHKTNTSLGTKDVILAKEIIIGQADAKTFIPNEEVTLMNWGNAIVSHITTDPTSGTVTALDLRLHLEGDVKKTEKKITWLANTASNLIPVEIFNFGHLLTKDKIEKEDDIMDCVAATSEFRTEAWADCNVSNLSEDDIMQFDRIGYYRVDRAYRDQRPAVFFNIPTGKGSEGLS